MSSCLRGGGRPYGLDPDIIRPSSSSSLSLSGRSLQSFSPSSTLSESCNSPCTISIKRARAPRKRLNQTYNEAAALLSTVYPNVFPIESLKCPLTKANHFYSFDESPALLPSFPVLDDDAYLIREGSQERPGYLFELKAASPVEISCSSPTSNEFREPGSPSPLDEDFDTESILDADVGEGIDSIMGSHRNSILTTSTNSDTSQEMKTTSNSHKCPFLQGLIGLQLGSKLEYGLGFGCRKNLHRTALRQRDSSEWWRCPFVPVHEIVPKLNKPVASAPSLDKKKKKKAKNKEEIAVQGMQNKVSTTRTSTVKATDTAAMANNTTTTTFSLQAMMEASGLGLKLNHEEVIKAWSGQSWMFPDGKDSPNSSAKAHTKLADIDLIEDGSGVGGAREASVLRYKEKRKTRLFSKKIRYQVRKMNADSRPRIKGKFVRRPVPLQQAINEES